MLLWKKKKTLSKLNLLTLRLVQKRLQNNSHNEINSYVNLPLPLPDNSMFLLIPLLKVH